MADESRTRLARWQREPPTCARLSSKVWNDAGWDMAKERVYQILPDWHKEMINALNDEQAMFGCLFVDDNCGLWMHLVWTSWLNPQVGLRWQPELKDDLGRPLPSLGLWECLGMPGTCGKSEKHFSRCMIFIGVKWREQIISDISYLNCCGCLLMII